MLYSMQKKKTKGKTTMRRVSNITKETMLFARARTVATMELQEAQSEKYTKNQYKSLEEIYDEIHSGLKDSVIKVLSYEIAELAETYGWDSKFISEEGTAFPEFDGLDDSIGDYAISLTDDLLELYTLPALEIVEELEDWLNELNEFHSLKGEK